MSKRTVYLKRPDDRVMLVPTDRKSEDLIKALRPGRIVMIRSHAARNGKHHRLLWAVAGLIAENSEHYDDAEHVVEQLKLATGHVKRVWYDVPGLGRIQQIRGASIAYESMSQEDFSAWFEKALIYIQSDMLPGVETETIRKEITEALGLDWWPAQRGIDLKQKDEVG
jgi:hypothetical protein|tara:strand:+ start:25067 stop:25570 length:504 start_codon:yes stop_codon:yes gene_type:complete